MKATDKKTFSRTMIELKPSLISMSQSVTLTSFSRTMIELKLVPVSV